MGAASCRAGTRATSRTSGATSARRNDNHVACICSVCSRCAALVLFSSSWAVVHWCYASTHVMVIYRLHPMAMRRTGIQAEL